MSRISRTRQARQWIIRRPSRHIRGHAGARYRCTGGGILVGVAGGALDHVYRVSGLDVVRAQRILVLHHTSRVDEALALDGNRLEVGARELGLEVEDGGCGGHGDVMVSVARGLDLEVDRGDGRVVGSFLFGGHVGGVVGR